MGIARKLLQKAAREPVSRDGILEWQVYSRFLGINSSLLRLEFMSDRLPSFFTFYKTLFMNRLEESRFSCFADFFVRIFKTREEYNFFKSASRWDCE
jgi:hypothetical protein